MVPPPPAELLPDGNPATCRPNPFDFSFRFGLLQADKLRERGDLANTQTNLARSALAPIQPASRGHIAQLSHFIAESGG